MRCTGELAGELEPWPQVSGPSSFSGNHSSVNHGNGEEADGDYTARTRLFARESYYCTVGIDGGFEGRVGASKDPNHNG